MTKITDLYHVDNNLLKNVLSKYTYPHEILPDIGKIILELEKHLDKDYKRFSENVFIHKSVEIGSNVEIIGPAIIMENVQLRHNAFIRENVIIGNNCVIGNSCEIKNSILLDYCEVPHFNYVGDSILGNHVHLGAGVVLANLRLDKKNIEIEKMDTHLRKVGAFLGDYVQVGCHTVLNPGTIVYKEVIIYPLNNVGGVIKSNQKGPREVEVKKL